MLGINATLWVCERERGRVHSVHHEIHILLDEGKIIPYKNRRDKDLYMHKSGSVTTDDCLHEMLVFLANIIN